MKFRGPKAQKTGHKKTMPCPTPGVVVVGADVVGNGGVGAGDIGFAGCAGWNKLETSFGESIVSAGGLMATRTNRLGTLARTDVDFDAYDRN